jgi:phage terminase large subunit-like protein
MQITPEMKSSVPFQYAYDVLEGKIITGKWIKLAAQRFFDWIETADQDGYMLNHKDGIFAINFFPMFLTHTKGPLAKAKQPFELAPYQQFVIYNIIAWVNIETKLRRINFVYDAVARKNGKTTLLSGLGLYLQSLDGESGPEIYVGATKEAQAKTLWEQAAAFVSSSVMLRTLGFRSKAREITFTQDNNVGVFRFLGGDSKTLDSLNPSAAFVDEYHAHKDDTVREVLESAMGARDQPLVYIITTAGFNLKSACKLAEDSYKDILLGLNKDNHTLIMIHQMDADDDWEDENNWQKANPSLKYVTTLMDFMRREYIKAKNQPSKIPNFKTKSLNMWVDGDNVWIPSEIWKQNDINFGLDKTLPKLKVDIQKFVQFGSFAALDLSTTTDITAFVILSEPDEDGIRYLMPFLFCPEDNIDKRSKDDGVPYRYWVDNGYMIATPGNRVDYDVIEDYVKGNYKKHNINRVEVDRWNSESISNHLLDAGLEVSEFSQTITNYSHPTKTFEKLVYEGKIKHDGNPVMEWMLSGCVTIEDHNENIRISKGKSHANGKRIDGIIAAIMALGGSLSPKEETNESIYNREGTEFTC